MKKQKILTRTYRLSEKIVKKIDHYAFLECRNANRSAFVEKALLEALDKREADEIIQSRRC